jgi:phosphate transport system substrate-binding protein
VVVPEPPAPVVVTPPPEPAPKPRERTVRTALRARGSNTIGGKLLPLVMEAFLKHEGAPVVRSRRTAAEESTLTADFPDAPESTGVDIAAHGSATAFDGLVAGLCDIGMSSRPVKDDEAAAAAAAGLGDLRSPACEHIIGLDGIAILVHPGNPVPSLTREQVARVFTGTVTNWSEVGGPNLNIQRYARDDKSGTYDSFKAMVLGTQTLAPGTRRYEDSAQLSDDVAADPGGVGFTGLAYVRSARAVPVAEIGGTPLLPTRFTVATEDYPLSRRLFLYTPSVAKSDWTRRFIEFVQSDAGQELVSRAGFVKQSIDLQRPVPPGEAPADYIDTVREADRLSLNFRFQAGSARLDNKAIRDMNRVTELLAQPRFQGRHLVLLGFTDAVGAPQVNVRLSRERAQAVARELETRGILPAVVTGFGAVLPIAANDNATGRDRNRRVEVWIR